MEKRMPENKSQLYDNEVAFFKEVFQGKKYNPVGWRLRLQREKKNLLRLAKIKNLGRVLSLGCGDGQFEIMLAPYAERITGLDISPEAVRSAKQAAEKSSVSNVEFRLQSIDQIKGNEDFDWIICLAFLHHIPPSDLPSLLDSIHTHLTVNGKFYSQDPNFHGVLRKIGRILLPNWINRYHSPDEYELDPAEMKRLLRRAGFCHIDIGFNDLTLIPGLYVLTRGFPIIMHLMVFIDWLWCHSPFARWASCFFISAEK
jgi:cyclopropane fatty-acyl-phospholipid synthase-like methyltransferase